MNVNLQVILITTIEGLRVEDKSDVETRRKLGWLPPESCNGSKVRIISKIHHFYVDIQNY